MSFITAPGLVSYSNTLVSSSPNNVIPVALFQAVGSAGNIDAALIPKANGAILASIPDNTANGGNKRGSFAVDLQRLRTAANHVAGGLRSGILSGESNRADGTSSVVAGGGLNYVAGQQGFIGAGGNNQAGATSADQNATVCGGSDNYADATNATIPGGQGAYTRAVNGYYAYSSFCAQQKSGQFQMSKLTEDLVTTDATPTRLRVGGSIGAAVAANRVAVLANNSAVSFKCLVTARSNTGDVAAWEVTGIAQRGINAASTTLVAPATVTLLGATAGAAAWALACTADTTFGAVALTGTGAAGTTIRWLGLHIRSEATF